VRVDALIAAAISARLNLRFLENAKSVDSGRPERAIGVAR
jgi:hypothetical protein